MLRGTSFVVWKCNQIGFNKRERPFDRLEHGTFVEVILTLAKWWFRKETTERMDTTNRIELNGNKRKLS
ncbi:MAG: hypothetical protein ACTS5F_02060 [Candidatus Hodgkinia cicadicola]